MSAHLRAVGVSRTEDASGAAGGCPQSVESAVLRAFEDASRTREGCFWHRISLPYRKSLFFTPNASENASRTPGSLFEHGAHIPYHRWPSPVPNARQMQVVHNMQYGFRPHSINFICVHICLHLFGILKLFKINAVGHPKPIIFHKLPLSGAKCLEIP